jgi:CMP-N-acetylneuraminic acid synthetase
MEDAAKNFPSIKLHERPDEIRGGDVPMNTILLHDTEQIEADWYLQTHSTNPLLKSETVTSAIDTFFAKLPEYDSLFTVTPTQTRFWNADGGAVNHDPTELIRTQDLVPIYEENSNIYIFNRETLKERGNRIGAKPLMFEMDRLEAIDIDEEEDFLMAQLLYNLREKGRSER